MPGVKLKVDKIFKGTLAFQLFVDQRKNGPRGIVLLLQAKNMKQVKKKTCDFTTGSIKTNLPLVSMGNL